MDGEKRRRKLVMELLLCAPVQGMWCVGCSTGCVFLPPSHWDGSKCAMGLGFFFGKKMYLSGQIQIFHQPRFP